MSESSSPERTAQPSPCVHPDSPISLPGSDTGLVPARSAAASIHNSTKPLIKRGVRKAKAPKDSRIYKAVLIYLALKAQGLKGPEIAEQIGITAHTLRQYVCYANKRGWLTIHHLDMPEDKVDVILASKAVRNIDRVLDETIAGEDGESRVMTVRAVDVALEVAKGVGLLKQHQVVKNDGAAPNVFALKVEVINAGTDSSISLRPGSFGGSPAYDAEVIEE